MAKAKPRKTPRPWESPQGAAPSLGGPASGGGQRTLYAIRHVPMKSGSKFSIEALGEVAGDPRSVLPEHTTYYCREGDTTWTRV